MLLVTDHLHLFFLSSPIVSGIKRFNKVAAATECKVDIFLSSHGRLDKLSLVTELLTSSKMNVWPTNEAIVGE